MLINDTIACWTGEIMVYLGWLCLLVAVTAKAIHAWATYSCRKLREARNARWLRSAIREKQERDSNG